MKLFDKSRSEMTIAKDCPWYEAQQTYGAPNVNWCEKTQCTYINEPANTYSNLGLIFIALLLLTKIKNKLVQHFSILVLIMGIASGVYHATNNYFTQFIDIIGMNFVSSFLLTFSLIRVLKKEHLKFYTLYFFITACNTLLLFIMESNGIAFQIIFFPQFFLTLILEAIIYFKNRNLKKHTFFLIALSFIAVAQTAAQIDLKKVYCNPGNLILHGHVIWHLLSAVGMFFFALHINHFSDKIKD